MFTAVRWGFISIVLAAAGAAFVGWAPAAGAAVIYQATAGADSYVSSFSPGDNYGGQTTLQVKAPNTLAGAKPTGAGTTMIAYLRFTLPQLEGKIGRATLKLYAQSAGNGLEVRETAGGFDENSVTYATAPGRGPLAGRAGAFGASRWVTVDVTPAVAGPGEINLAVSTSSVIITSFSSREAAAGAPLLEVETHPTYYVDAAAGNDTNSGMSPSAPWKTLAKVSNTALAPRDAVLFRRGQSWTGELTVASSGSPGAPITIGAYGAGDPPVIQGGASCIYLDGSYVSVTEVTLQNCQWAGVDIYGSNNRVERAALKGSAAGVVVNAGANANVIAGNQITDNVRMSVLTQIPGNDDSGAFGVLLLGDGNVVAYNTISGHDAFSYDYGRDGAAVEIYGGQRNVIHHNRASQNNAFTELGHARSTGNTFAYNSFNSTLENSFFLVTRGAADTFGPVARTSMFNNSINLTGSSAEGFVCYAGCNGDLLVMQNNIVRAARKVGYADGPFVQSHNLFSVGLIQFLADITSLLDPGWVDGSAGDLHLNSLSRAIDAGAPTGFDSDLDGAAVPQDGNGDGVGVPDIGAFEYRP